MDVPGRIRRRRRGAAGFRSAAEDRLGVERRRGRLDGLEIFVRAIVQIDEWLSFLLSCR